ncbi:glycoside hydrolase family 43 protein [Actinoallomurus sp. CA-150999]|uniref:glycoside hydrolase family 43 protein n=1 Tax=Actinoallomurus sp. CA-150999 TaxID=3239887 RepID=UPI003D9362EC
MGEQSRRRVLQAGLGAVAGSVALGRLGGTAGAAERAAAAAPAASTAGRPTGLPWVADLGDGRYQNPVLGADWSDPDAVRVGPYFYLTASTFNRIPGLPILRSRDLVNWTIIGHALTELEPRDVFGVPQHGNGVWAPAIRHHAGRFWIFYPDPDYGIFVTTAVDPTGPWTKPHVLKPGKGFIDPSPLWDDDGRAYLIHAYAKSRAGINNRLTLHEISPDGRELLDDGRIVVNGDEIPGYTTLEGPKLYKRDGWYWILAPVGGVTGGWQSAFRSRSILGPYENRIVLAQGDTPINGPHQGAWVATERGEDWFLHFQDRGVYGRVVHLQPMRWRDDGWPVMGEDDGSGRGKPVLVYRKPAVGRPSKITAPASGDEFTGHRLGEQWTWQANSDPSWASLRGGRLRLACPPSADTADLRLLPNVLGQRFPAESFIATTSLTLHARSAGARSGLVVLGYGYAWIGLQRLDSGLALVHRTAAQDKAEVDAAAPIPLPRGRSSVRLRVEVGPGGVCRFAADVDGRGFQPVGGPFTASQGKWIGATLGLFGTAPAGAHGDAAEADWFRVGPAEG